MKTNPTIAIVDYGLSNLFSIAKALRRFAANTVITDELSVIESADAVVLPGVGSFEEGMKGLQTRGLVSGLKTFAASGKPFLGICLGAQLLLSRGQEFGTFDGLEIIAGDVVKFPELKNAKVPHMGWNAITPGSGSWAGTILDGISPGATMYFVHSYILQPEGPENVFAVTEHGGMEFCSVVRKNNIYGCQFHPEKSGAEGLRLINNFINLI